MPTTVLIGFDVTVAVEKRRDGYFAATTKPFGITAYGGTVNEAEKRAEEALDLLVGNHNKTPNELSSFLNRLNVKYNVKASENERVPSPTRRECKQEKRVRVPVGA